MEKLRGSALRDRIADILRLKYRDVSKEIRLISTTADVLFVDDTNHTFKRRIAIESKDWTKPFTSSDLAKIHNLYQPSLTNRQIDYLWIVGNFTLSSSPMATIRSFQNVVYSTFDEFLASLMNFQPIILDNMLSFSNHDSSRNFIHSRAKGREATLEAEVLDWLNTDQIGMIIYGGYGTGKTSFSLYIASKLSQEYSQKSFARIPIRISLGGLFTKQDLASLICSTLSASESGANVKDFSYNLFIELNKLGQLIIILDGFDEMRHAMDIDDFVFTFEQLSILFQGRAKILILGRPDSFFDTDEEERVMNAVFERIAEAKQKVRKCEVSFLSESEINSYLSIYIEKNRSGPDAHLMSKLEHIKNTYIRDEFDVLSRPVQLNMFTKVVVDFLDRGIKFNRFNLYQSFMNRIVSREGSKAARIISLPQGGKVGYSDPRSIFVQNIAWWLLTRKRENRFYATEIPKDLIPLQLREKHGDEAALREALVGSVIEHVDVGILGKKGPKYYYFPHKSYIEFLVSNYFLRETFTTGMYRDIIDNINSEILSFIREGPDQGKDNLRAGLRYLTGRISEDVLSVCVDVKDFVFEDKNQRHHGQRHHGLLADEIYIYYQRKKVTGTYQQRNSFLRGAFVNTQTIDGLYAVLVCAVDSLSLDIDDSLMKYIYINCYNSIPAFMVTSMIERNIVPKFHTMEVGNVKSLLFFMCTIFDPSNRSVKIKLSDVSALAEKVAMKSLIVEFHSKKRTEPIEYKLDELRSGVGMEGGGDDRIAKLMERTVGGRFSAEIGKGI